MRIKLNGEAVEVEDGITVAALLAKLGVVTRAVAVAVNSAVVPRAALYGRMLAEGDDVEVIEAVGGG